eukprot:1628414-Rhodomonas_salina.1
MWKSTSCRRGDALFCPAVEVVAGPGFSHGFGNYAFGGLVELIRHGPCRVRIARLLQEARSEDRPGYVSFANAENCSSSRDIALPGHAGDQAISTSTAAFSSLISWVCAGAVRYYWPVAQEPHRHRKQGHLFRADPRPRPSTGIRAPPKWQLRCSSLPFLPACIPAVSCISTITPICATEPCRSRIKLAAVAGVCSGDCREAGIRDQGSGIRAHGGGERRQRLRADAESSGSGK